jgi:hypothetical protein
MCDGLDLCSKKNCLEQERCVFPVRVSLLFKIEGPPVIDKIHVNVFSCKKHRKLCSSDRACEILGQCMYDHTAVKASNKFKKELNKANNIQEISNIFVSRLAKVKRKPKT